MMKMRSILLTAAAFFVLGAGSHAALRVTALHPVLGDLTRQVGGDAVIVTDLMKPGTDPHDFAPTPSDLSAIAKSKVILAMGKGLEPYLPKLRASLTKDQRLVEVGRPIPSIKIAKGSELFVCCPTHSEGAIDPHWWTSVANMSRAARGVAKALGEGDPPNASTYKARAKAYDKRLDALRKWIKEQVAAIPRRDRILATSHLAFGYFCKEFGFRTIGVQGLTTEQEASVKHIAEAIATLKKEKVKAVFPERTANPKVLRRMAKEAGVKIGGELDPAFTGGGDRGTYESITRRNVRTIVEALK